MSMQETDLPPSQTTQITPPAQIRTRMLLFGGLVAGAVALLAILTIQNESASFLTGGNSVLILALPAFLAGIFSLLSPCTLPILPAYFAFTFQSSRSTIVGMSVAFFLGLATTLTLLGAAATALASLLFQYLDQLTFWGGLIIIAFGVMSILGKGFAGPQVSERPATSVVGSYLYGATFALGWSACVGPILGALLTLLASQGIGIVQGGVLALIYSMGLGMPLIGLAAFFSKMDRDSWFWRFLRGRGFEVKIGSYPLYLHTTSIASGVLLIAMGALLASGHLEALTVAAQDSPFSQWVLEIETQIGRLFGLY